MLLCKSSVSKWKEGTSQKQRRRGQKGWAPKRVSACAFGLAGLEDVRHAPKEMGMTGVDG
jgi:hypothetical protein